MPSRERVQAFVDAVVAKDFGKRLAAYATFDAQEEVNVVYPG